MMEINAKYTLTLDKDEYADLCKILRLFRRLAGRSPEMYREDGWDMFISQADVIGAVNVAEAILI